MTMLHHTGFEGGTLRVMDAWTTGASISSAIKRNGSYALFLDGSGGLHSAQKLVTAGDEFNIRCGVYVTSGRVGIGLLEGITSHVIVDLSPPIVEARRGDLGGQILGSGGAVNYAQWYLLEYHGKIHDTAGVLQVKLDGNLLIDLSGVDTRNAGATGVVDRYAFQASGAPVGKGYFDDLAICNPLGARNNSWLGNGYGLYLPADSPGDMAQLNRTSGAANWECVDDVPPNDDVDYVFSDVLDAQDLYNLIASGVPDATIVNAVTAMANAKLAAPGAGNLQVGVRVGLDSWSADQALASDTWKAIRHLLETTPLGSLWTKSDLDGLQVGVRIR